LTSGCGEPDELDIEKQVEEFRLKLARVVSNQKKMKPNISTAWLKSLREKLSSSENSKAVPKSASPGGKRAK
jgi:hypothetical protein